MFEVLRRDAARYAGLGGWYSNLGFWAGATYRLGSFAHSVRSRIFRIPLTALYYLLRIPWRIFFNVQICASARIGPGLCLIHPNNVLIASADLGENCLIFHEVTIATNVAPPGLPKIGNDVDIYTGARVLGGIVVGDGAKIGANCVVSSNVCAGSVVVTAPNRVVPASLVAVFSRRPQAPEAPAVPAGRVGSAQG
jgi:serine O-acetyltransferase